MRKKKIFIFLTGFVLMILIMPLLSKLGVPSYNQFLTTVFGEQNIWAIVFTIILLTLLLVRIKKSKKVSKGA